MSMINVKTLKFKWPNKKSHINIPLYGGDFYFCTDREEFKQISDYLITAQDTAHYSDGCLGCVTPLQNELGGALYLVGVFDGTYGVLAHEIGHLALFILDRAGVPVDAENSEAFCYLQGHLFEVCQPLLDTANLADMETQAAALVEAGEEVPATTQSFIDAMKSREKPAKGSKGKGARHGGR